MKLCNIKVNGAAHLAVETARGLVDATAAGCPLDMDAFIAGADLALLESIFFRSFAFYSAFYSARRLKYCSIASR